MRRIFGLTRLVLIGVSFMPTLVCAQVKNKDRKLQ